MTGGHIVFLGLSERAAYVQDGNSNIRKWTIIGLKNVVTSYIFPISLSGWQIGFAIPDHLIGKQTNVDFVNESGKSIGHVKIGLTKIGPDDAGFGINIGGPSVLSVENGHTVVFGSLDDIGMTIPTPGDYFLQVGDQNTQTTIGRLHFAVVDPKPLTPERSAAVRSDPGATKAVRLELGCNSCSTKFRVYAGLDKNENLNAEGWQWYENIADQFDCECGRTSIDLTIIRRNLHGLLGSWLKLGPGLQVIPLYEKSVLHTIRTDYKNLIDKSPKEESLQVFIEENPVLLHQFPARLIYSKPPILTKFYADFAIVTTRKELVLIEIEKTDTRLLKKNGGISAQLTHAFDQVRDWLHILDEHRLAALDSMNVSRDDVTSVRGIVIAGRDGGYDAQDLRKLKGADFGNITLLTFDDILYSLDALVERLGTM